MATNFAQRAMNVKFEAFEQVDPHGYLIKLDGLAIQVPKEVFDKLIVHLKWRKMSTTETRITYGPGGS